jgi:hypothetical protein
MHWYVRLVPLLNLCSPVTYRITLFVNVFLYITSFSFRHVVGILVMT